MNNYPVRFVDVMGQDEVDNQGSYRNITEAQAISRYINFFKGLRNVEGNSMIRDEDIGIIAPYKYQASLIREQLRENPNIQVNTVEKFQGTEKPIIIITTVRTEKELGFMADDLRLNTAISRAKDCLIVIGKSSTLEMFDSWKK